jgi:RNA polymerase sigma-70 factor, ECF subfamily
MFRSRPDERRAHSGSDESEDETICKGLGSVTARIDGDRISVPGLGDESADLAQEVLVVVFGEVPRFNRQREGSFRAWLCQMTVNKVRNLRRKRQRRPAVGLDPADGFLERLSDPNDDLAREWDRDHDSHVVGKLLAVVRNDFSSSTWEAFRRFGVDNVPVGEVAEELGLSENAVILARSRVLKRLREEAGELL